MVSNRRQMSVVHDRDLDDLIDALGLRSRMYAGELRCAVCNTTITRDNLGGVYAERGQVLALCDSRSCVDERTPTEGDR
jgi:hypothetical protein